MKVTTPGARYNALVPPGSPVALFENDMSVVIAGSTLIIAHDDEVRQRISLRYGGGTTKSKPDDEELRALGETCLARIKDLSKLAAFCGVSEKEEDERPREDQPEEREDPPAPEEDKRDVGFSQPEVEDVAPDPVPGGSESGGMGGSVGDEPSGETSCLPDERVAPTS